MSVRGLLISVAQCFISVVEILMYPVDFLLLRDFIVLIVSPSVTEIDFISIILSGQDFF